MISDSYQKDKLKKYNINIKTKYIVGNKILEKNTDESINDDIKNGIRCEKQYYINGILAHTEKKFDSRIEYTFTLDDELDVNYTCPNCGMTSELKNFVDGCPYCKTYYNIDYLDKDLGSKYHYDRVLESNIYKIITAVIDIVISVFLSYIFIKNTSRTFNNIDVYKILIYGLILSIVLYYFFYMYDAYIILGPIKKYKDIQNKKQKQFWDKTKIDKKVFFNNLNYELGKYYYSKENIIDYDILDYYKLKYFYKRGLLYANVYAEVRIVTISNNKIKAKTIRDNFIMKKRGDNLINLRDGANIITCSSCGTSIDARKEKCEYCNHKTNYLQEWILEK